MTDAAAGGGPDRGGAEGGEADRGGSAPRRGRAGAFAALALLALVWGYSWVALKISTRDASPLAIAALRNGLGAVALLTFLAVKRRSLRPPPFWPTFVYGLLQTVGFTIPQTVAVSLGAAGRIAVLAYTMPFWLALLAWPLLGERIGRARWGALALAGVGLWLVVGPLEARSTLSGLLGVAAGLLWAMSAVWFVRAFLVRGYDLLSVTTWQMVWGSVVLVVLAVAFPGRIHVTPSFVASIAFLAVGATAIGWALWTFVLSRLPASVAGLGSLATPVVGVALSALQLGEVPPRAELVGMACIVVALVVNGRAGRTAARRR